MKCYKLKLVYLDNLLIFKWIYRKAPANERRRVAHHEWLHLLHRVVLVNFIF